MGRKRQASWVVTALVVPALVRCSMLDKAAEMLECHVCKTSQLTGTVDDCCIDFRTVDEATANFFLPTLTAAQNTTFFKYFKVNLNKQCPFWEEDGQCFMRDCSVCDSNPQDIPKPWLEQDRKAALLLERSAGSSAADVAPGDDCQEQLRKEQECKAALKVEAKFGKVDHGQSNPQTDHFNPWAEPAQEVWTEQDDEEDDMAYVNLALNPEKFTGYSGASAQKVWRSIYMENCFTFDHTCQEKRVFFRLISGLQSSITTQVALDFRFEDGTWGPNVELFTRAVGQHPDRMTNMYFAHVFLLRALAKAKPVLLSMDYDTGNPTEDQQARELVHKLLSCDSSQNKTGKASEAEQDAAMCMRGFDESNLFQVPAAEGRTPQEYWSQQQDMATLKEEFMAKFHNISRIMDCVGCEKCKMWGKLETLGIGTAIKIMLASEAQESIEGFNRNEVIALVNTAAQLAKSVGAVPHFRRIELKHYVKVNVRRIAMAVLAVLVVVSIGRRLLAWLFQSRPADSRRAGDATGAANGTGNGHAGGAYLRPPNSPQPEGLRKRPGRPS